MKNNRFKIIYGVFLFLWAIFLPANSLGTEADNRPLPYHFQSETVWGRVTVLVEDFHGRFHLEAQCDSPASRWFLKDEKDRTAAHGNLNGSNSFKADILRPFQDSYQLTVMMKGDQGEVPLVVRLSPSGEQIWLTPTPPPYDAFAENPEHPYDKIVKNLYDQAAQAYVAGDMEKALEWLKKAAELDPVQPQVRSLEAKIKRGLEDSVSREAIGRASADWKKGDAEQALNELDGLLDQYPDDGPALQLKKQIVQAQTSKPEKTVTPKKKHKSKLATTVGSTPVVEKPASNDSDRQAQADQAYNLGLESYRKDDYASAKKFWEQTLQLQPTHTQARRNLDRLIEEHPELK